MLSGGSIEFDYLVVATGATHSYFGHEDWAAAAPGLKSLDDATLIRRRVLTAFEQAEMERDKTALDRLLRFVIVGGGPTGVELAGSIAELARHTLAADFRRIDPRSAKVMLVELAADFRRIDPRSAKVMLVEAGSRLLPSFHESLSHYAHRSLERLNVEVRLGSAVTDCSAAGVVLGGETIPAATVIWAAGVAATPVGRWLDAKMDRSGKVIVESDLSVPGHPDIFVIGDAALVLNERGDAVPGIAPAAKQQGRYVGRVIGARIRKVPLPGDFRYRDAGGLATIGRKSAVIEFHRIRLKGWLAWWIWGIAHIYFLVGVPSPLLVSIRWLWEYITYGRGARLIIRAKDAD
jgi:NADH dehydrogenase